MTTAPGTSAPQWQLELTVAVDQLSYSPLLLCPVSSPPSHRVPEARRQLTFRKGRQSVHLVARFSLHSCALWWELLVLQWFPDPSLALQDPHRPRTFGLVTVQSPKRGLRSALIPPVSCLLPHCSSGPLRPHWQVRQGLQNLADSPVSRDSASLQSLPLSLITT